MRRLMRNLCLVLAARGGRQLAASLGKSEISADHYSPPYAWADKGLSDKEQIVTSETGRMKSPSL